MALHRGKRKTGNLLVGNSRFDFDFFSQSAEPGAQDDPNIGSEIRVGLDRCYGSLNPIIQHQGSGHGAFTGMVSSGEAAPSGRTRRCKPSTSPRCRSKSVRKLATYAV